MSMTQNQNTEPGRAVHIPARRAVLDSNEINDRALGFIVMAIGLALLAVAFAFLAVGGLS